jgi:hypothetical protein
MPVALPPSLAKESHHAATSFHSNRVTRNSPCRRGCESFLIHLALIASGGDLFIYFYFAINADGRDRFANLSVHREAIHPDWSRTRLAGIDASSGLKRSRITIVDSKIVSAPILGGFLRDVTDGSAQKADQVFTYDVRTRPRRVVRESVKVSPRAYTPYGQFWGRSKTINKLNDKKGPETCAGAKPDSLIGNTRETLIGPRLLPNRGLSGIDI